MSQSQHMHDYPHVNAMAANYGPETVRTLGAMVEKFYQYKETREVIQGNLAILEQRFAVFDHSKKSLEDGHKEMRALFKSMIDLARENPNNPEIVKLILPGFVHLLNATPNFMQEGLAYLDRMTPPSPIS